VGLAVLPADQLSSWSSRLKRRLRPRLAAHEESMRIGENARSTVQGERMTATLLDVLIVDDSTVIRKVLQRVLRQMDLPLGEIYEAGDGREAVDILKKHRVGLVLSDMNMPHMDGLQLLARIKDMAHMKEVPIVMITTESRQGKVMEALQLGATGYVRKPFTAEQIKDKLTVVLNSAITCREPPSTIGSTDLPS
jgi:two-component system chemotaxis response regulator CheY